MSWSRIALEVRSDPGPVPGYRQPDSGRTKVFVFLQTAASGHLGTFFRRHTLPLLELRRIASPQ